MNLDMDEINKLNPRGLHDLRPMLFVVEVITALITKQVADSRMMLKLVRALGRYEKQVRDNAAFNLNVKIKAWVLARAERRAWVRGIIGEAAINRWQTRYDNLAHPIEVSPVRHKAVRTAPKLDVLPYKWKRFAMADLSWLETRPFPGRDTSAPAARSNWQQPRGHRDFKPVEFWAFELAEDYQPNNDVLGEATNRGDEKTVREKGAELDAPDPPPKQGTAQKKSKTEPKDAQYKPP